jgi:hypothetical protein
MDLEATIEFAKSKGLSNTEIAGAILNGLISKKQNKKECKILYQRIKKELNDVDEDNFFTKEVDVYNLIEDENFTFDYPSTMLETLLNESGMETITRNNRVVARFIRTYL